MRRLLTGIAHLARQNRTTRKRVGRLRAWPSFEGLEERCVLNTSYGGGPLIQNVEVVPIFYGSAWTSQAQQDQIELLHTFFASITTSSLMTFLSEYSVTPATPGYNNSSYTIGKGTVWSGYDLINTSVGSVLDDRTFSSIIQSEISAKHVPAPTANTVYFLFTPPGAKVFDVVGPNGVGHSREWYGYHISYSTPSSPTGSVYYAAITNPAAPNQSVGGAVGSKTMNVFQSLTEISVHELAEAITDPLADNSGWTDPAFPSDGEVADMGLEPTAYDQRNSFYQPNWVTLLNDYVVPQLWDRLLQRPVSIPGASAGATTSATSLATLTAPTLHALGVPITQHKPPTFSWSTIKNANWYEFEIDNVTTNNFYTQTISTPSTTYAVIAGRTYKYRVRALSNDGVLGQWSAFSPAFTVTP